LAELGLILSMEVDPSRGRQLFCRSWSRRIQDMRWVVGVTGLVLMSGATTGRAVEVLSHKAPRMIGPVARITKDCFMYMHRAASPSRAALVPAILSLAIAYTAQAATAPAATQLSVLAEEFYITRAQFDPLNFATANGDSRFDDQIGMSIAPKVRAAYFARIHRLQKQLAQVPRATLSDADQLNEDILAFELSSSLDLEHFPEHLLPLNQMDNVPSTLANYASGTGSQPLTTPKQYRAYLQRLRQLSGWIDQAIGNMREGMRSGVVLPKTITMAMSPQFERMQSATPEASIFYTPIKNLPEQFSKDDKQELTAAYRDVIVNQLSPALQRLNHFIQSDYLPASRDTSGLSALPNGSAWYLARIKNNTNLPLTPAAVHQLGLREVARIQREFTELGPKLGYDGPPNELSQWVFAQKKFKPFTTDAQVLKAYQEIYAAVSLQLPAYFHILPKARLSLQLEPELTRATASDHYTPLAADGSHPGVFWPVVNDPRDYSTVGMVTLFLHEGVPGHHLHAALLKEMNLPDFRKFNTENSDTAAYTEGWALYSETLGKEFGFYEHPDAYFGHLNDELLRAVRLVVDTGIHAEGWSREKAIGYARDTLGYSDARAQNQIERYMVMPAQALSYKIGALKILELRERARLGLGGKFTYAGFHDVVIGDGTLPLPILEARVNAWITREGGSKPDLENPEVKKSQ
jgi:uncharacterized protein (DUF885 family)